DPRRHAFRGGQGQRKEISEASLRPHVPAAQRRSSPLPFNRGRQRLVGPSRKRFGFVPTQLDHRTIILLKSNVLTGFPRFGLLEALAIEWSVTPVGNFHHIHQEGIDTINLPRNRE